MDQNAHNRDTGTCAVRCRQEAAPGSGKARTRDRSVVPTGPWDNFAANQNHRQFQKLNWPPADVCSKGNSRTAVMVADCQSCRFNQSHPKITELTEASLALNVFRIWIVRPHRRAGRQPCAAPFTCSMVRALGYEAFRFDNQNGSGGFPGVLTGHLPGGTLSQRVLRPASATPQPSL